MHLRNSNNMNEYQEQFDAWNSQIGSIPDPTCPAINSAQKDLGRAEDYVKSIVKKCDTCSDEAKFALYEIGDVYNALEKLRKENEILRDHAEFWRKKCAELAKDADAFLQENQEELKQLDAYRSLDDNFDIQESVEYYVRYSSGEGMWSLQETNEAKEVMLRLFRLLKKVKQKK